MVGIIAVTEVEFGSVYLGILIALIISDPFVSGGNDVSSDMDDWEFFVAIIPLVFDIPDTMICGRLVISTLAVLFTSFAESLVRVSSVV